MQRLINLLIAAGAGVVSLAAGGALALGLGLAAYDETAERPQDSTALHAHDDAQGTLDEPSTDASILAESVAAPTPHHHDASPQKDPPTSGGAADGVHAHEGAAPAQNGEPVAQSRTDDHQHGPVSATADQIACGNDLVRRTQEATARLADFSVAVAEGYRGNPAKPEATHYANRAYQRDGELMDLAHPEALVYQTNPRTGEKTLLGALFKMPRGQAGPQPCGAVTHWHSHAACSNRATGDVIPVAHGAPCAEGYAYGESVQMMHVWFVPGRKNGVAPVVSGLMS
jgi:hypothetical protein